MTVRVAVIPIVILWLGSVAPALPQAPPSPPPDQKTAEIIVQESREAAARKGEACVCPEDKTRGGQPCGDQSLYRRAKSAKPYCYVSDVPLEEIRRYWRR